MAAKLDLSGADLMGGGSSQYLEICDIDDSNTTNEAKMLNLNRGRTDSSFTLKTAEEIKMEY